MAQKHKNYIPQQRRPKQLSTELEPALEKEPALIDSYEHLAELLRVSDDWLNEKNIDSLGSYMYAKYMIALDANIDDDVDVSKSKLAMLRAAKTIQYSDNLFLHRGYDLGERPTTFTSMSFFQKQELPEKMMDIFVSELTPKDDFSDLPRSLFPNLSIAPFVATFTINTRIAGSARLALNEAAILEDEFDYSEHFGYSDEQLHTIDASMRAYYMNLSDNPARARNKSAAAVLGLRNPELSSFIDEELKHIKLHEDESEVPIDASSELAFAGQEVDFAILPKGTDVRDYTEALYGSLSNKERAYVDLKRVEVLEKIREIMGPERCYYMHGIPREQGDASIHKNYIGLVMQNHDQNGNVVSEDAIAVSPLALKDAGYIFRSDYSTHTSWRNTLSLPKKSAQSNGARPLKFTSVTGRDTYEAYVDKAIELLTCPPEQFGPGNELYYSGKKAEYVLRKRARVILAKRALEAASQSSN